MTAAELRLDYFKIYDVSNDQAGQIVGLQGQFDEQMEKAQLTYLDFFGNPASKNGEPIYDKNAHLTWYDIYDPVPDPIRVVSYENQFGRETLYTGRACAMLAPTWKVEKDSEYPRKLDHYKVYQVLRGEPLAQAIKLEDQFGGGEARIYDPIFFAVPVRMWWQGKIQEIQNPKAHLMIYRIYPESCPRPVPTRDQFGQRYLQVFRSVLLGAPSVKLEWKVID